MSRVRVKICGVKDERAIRAATDAGADALGFVFALSVRQVEPERAAALADGLPATVTTVGVFRYPAVEEILQVLDAFQPDLVQAEPGRAILGRFERLLPVFHDSESLIDRVTRFREAYATEIPVLLEAQGRGGRGVRPSWDRAATLAGVGELVLAGGLTPDNVADAIRTVRPYGVDVSSGVESKPGVKDPTKIEAFIEAVRRVEEELEG